MLRRARDTGHYQFTSGAAHEGGKLSIKADGILEERRVADALIDRELGARNRYAMLS